ncbi:hypothetical protein AOQ84DRAFT_419568 [Glonium stellatum]|uniref:Class II aldolase/adducin N-terminal domain-containing protein n=1 Tax=Glonium stellatum TaxID=574774 RepID=A0A8E2JX78_9PEZI|nr:hypothetical protein AOQ84DRAFT_419568 [Glonium stellatum]
MGGFLGGGKEGVRIWDIRDTYGTSSGVDKNVADKPKKNLLVCEQHLGDSFAAAFGDEKGELERFVVLQRGHGFVSVGDSIQQLVYRAISTQENAAVQQKAEIMAEDEGVEVNFLTEEEARDCAEMNVPS